MTTSASFRMGSRAGSRAEVLLGNCSSDRSAKAREVEGGETVLPLLAKDVEGVIEGDDGPASCSWAAGVVVEGSERF